ncbi:MULTISPECIES: hypothetical protein [Atlantibacter]|jgi:hypothetical protein|uniref:hypothetical protein n=1 Tax=Atlantibacter TaxID=1903434 RepID=UPI0005C20412|nr:MULTISPECIES: hypothetical protein [Atlantibacter]MCQ4968146.1 hypothetical protein [Enterobacteriaceae bacterium DFI.7.85]KIU33857.1 hypothetical protein SR38_10210 [Atlantibacter hermannii]MBW9430509.1 hypothetical protein [Atlantibacter hermannii]MDQ7881207.1 hypothetical protein [Atlantibacter hermannii]MDU1950680.1 hypothetical protein [Atlantibacter hermannii]
MAKEMFEFTDIDIESIAYSVAFSEWLGIDNLQRCTLARFTDEEMQKYKHKLEHFRDFFKNASGEDYFSHYLLHKKGD